MFQSVMQNSETAMVSSAQVLESLQHPVLGSKPNQRVEAERLS
jgi:hypothetical protein